MTNLIVLGCRIVIAVCAVIADHYTPNPNDHDFQAWTDEMREAEND
jgi:hypothetical protein